MSDKDLVWRDYRIRWPFKDVVYYSSEDNINNLKELTAILHADYINLVIVDEQFPVKIWYNRSIKKLVIENCTVKLTYNDTETVRVKVKNNG